MKDCNAIPKSLQKYTFRNGYHYSVQLRGSKAITAEKETIARLVRYNEITNLYISPFKADPVGTEQIQPFRSLYARFPSGWDRDGCGVAVLDAYHNALLYHSIRSEEEANTTLSADGPPIEKAGWRVFHTQKEASSFVIDFIQNGIRKDIQLDVHPVDPDLLQWLCSTLRQNIKAPTDLEHISELKAADFSQRSPIFPDWLRPVPGDWRLIGSLPQLERLEFTHVCIDIQ